MIPTQPHIDITPISLLLVGTSQRRIPTPSNLFPSLCDVCIRSPMPPHGATTTTALSSTEQLSSRRSYKIDRDQKKRMDVHLSLTRSLDR